MDIESLIKTFSEHEIKAKKENERAKQAYIENNPGEEIPELFTDDFCLPTALKFICSEIQSLKEKLEAK